MDIVPIPTQAHRGGYKNLLIFVLFHAIVLDQHGKDLVMDENKDTEEHNLTSTGIPKDIISERANKLFEEALAIQREEALQAGAIGYMARVLAQVTLPHSKPKTNEFSRTNGGLTLNVYAQKKIGLPYGAAPRLQLSWLITEAVVTKDRRIRLGETLSSFMKEVGLNPVYGKRGNVKMFREQMIKLLSSTFACSFNGEIEKLRGISSKQMIIADQHDIWWDPLKPEQVSLWDSEIILSEKFFAEATERPVPVDLRALKALKSSPMALDIYTWLTHRFSYLSQSRVIPWDALRLQLGADYKDTRQGRAAFRAAFLKHLKKVHVIYPEAKFSEDKKGLLLIPSPPHVNKKTRIYLPGKDLASQE